MHSVSRYGGFRDPALHHSSVRRYNLDFRPAYRPPEALIQDGSSNLRLYVVARRNSISHLQSYLPYDLYTQNYEWDPIQEPVQAPDEDIFDRSIASSEDGASPYRAHESSPLIAQQSPASQSSGFYSFRRGVPSRYAVPDSTAKRSVTPPPRVASPVQEPYHPEEDLQPQDEGPAYNYEPETYHHMSPEVVASRSPAPRNVSFAKSVPLASPKQRGKRTLSGSRNIEHLTPTGFSPFASFGAVYSNGLGGDDGTDIPSVTANALANMERFKRREATVTVNKMAPSTAQNVATTTEKKTRAKGRSRKGAKKSIVPVPEEEELHASEAPEMRIGYVADLTVDDYSSHEIEPYEDSAVIYPGEATIAGPMDTSDLAIAEEQPAKQKRKRSKKDHDNIEVAAIENQIEVANPEKTVTGSTRQHPTVHTADMYTDQGVQAELMRPSGISVGTGDDELQMDEYSTFTENVEKGRLGLDPRQKPTTPQAKRNRKPVNSAMLLNSWYISYGNERNKRKKYEPVEPQSDRNRRYPSRSRLPPIQHWNSNLSSDGSSVLFLIGVTSDGQKMGMQAQHASGDVVIFNEDGPSLDNSASVVRIPAEEMPEASLVLTDSHGIMEMQVIEPSSEQPLAIADVGTSTPKRRSASLTIVTKRLPVNSKSAKTREALLPMADRPVSPRRAVAKKSNTRKRGTSRKKHELTVREALEILNTDSDYPVDQGLAKLDETKEGTTKPRRQSNFQQQTSLDSIRPGDSSVPAPDSVTMQNGKQISYRSVFRVDEVETQIYNGSIFQPMIMNSRCRTSNVIIPVGRQVDMGNVKANFICGYLYNGEHVSIRGLGTSWPLKKQHSFFLPMFEEWAIHNSSETMDANIALTFVTI